MKTKQKVLAVLSACAVCAGGVKIADAAKSKQGKPKAGAPTFSVLYEWRTGTVAPPYQSHYNIQLSSGHRGSMTMRPGVSGDEPPVWRQSFPVSPHALEALRAMMSVHGVFSRDWQKAGPGQRPIGGGSEDLQVVSNGRTFSIPSYLGDRQAEPDAQAVYTAINALVPAKVRANIEAQHQRYLKQKAR